MGTSTKWATQNACCRDGLEGYPWVRTGSIGFAVLSLIFLSPILTSMGTGHYKSFRSAGGLSQFQDYISGRGEDIEVYKGPRNGVHQRGYSSH